MICKFTLHDFDRHVRHTICPQYLGCCLGAGHAPLIVDLCVLGIGDLTLNCAYIINIRAGAINIR